MNLEAKVAVVTGGSRGIGRAVACELASAGGRVVLIARGQLQLDEAVRDIQMRTGRSVIALSADVGSMHSVHEAFQRVLDTFTRVDILVNAAGINIRKGILQTTEAEWDEVIRINLKGVFNTCKVASAIMAAQRDGAIVNVSSAQARTGGTSPHYSASKAGIHGLTFALARELAQYNIRVNAVAPGATETDMARLWPLETRLQLAEKAVLHRLADPFEIAKAVVFLVSNDASFITGTVLDVNGGAWMG